MFQRDDGFLIRVEQPSDSGESNDCVLFRLFEEVSGMVSDYKMSFVQLDEQFRFHVELMNPTKRRERYEWISERLAWKENEGELAVVLVSKKVANLQKFEFSPNALLPTSRFTEYQYREVTEYIKLREEKRLVNIQVREQQSLEKFTNAHLSRRTKCDNTENVSGVTVEDKSDSRANTANRMHILDQLRNDRISEKLKKRTVCESLQISAILKRGKEHTEFARDLHTKWRAAKTEKSLQIQAEKNTFLNSMHSLERKREDNLRMREARLHTRDKQYLQLIKSQIANEKKNQKIIAEKRKNAAFKLF